MRLSQALPYQGLKLRPIPVQTQEGITGGRSLCPPAVLLSLRTSESSVSLPWLGALGLERLSISSSRLTLPQAGLSFQSQYKNSPACSQWSQR